MQLSILKSANNEEEQQSDEDNLPHVKKLLKKLVMPWANTNMIFCADSYLESVPTAEELWKHGLRFIGVIKTETLQFPIAYLSNIEFQNCGDMSGFLTIPVDRMNPVLGDFFLADQDRR